MKRFLLLTFLLAARVALASADNSPSDYYSVENIPTPPGLSAEVGGLAFAPDGRLVACFHRGEVYFYDPEKKEWKLFAQGLQDPLGIVAPKNNEVIVMQRSELTRLRDTKGDGVADSYETICDSFGMTGNYHEFAFGPLPTPDGGWFVALNTASGGAGVRQEKRGEFRENLVDGRMYSAVPWRGWVVKIAADGKLTPWASGFRSPNGLGFDTKGRLFVSDNQGDWLGACPLYHVEKDKFYGHPAALGWKKGETREPLKIPVKDLDAMRTRGSIIFPYNTMSNSPTQPITDTTGGKFGPFAGQMLIGEMNHPRMLRVAMEEVDGQLQGMAAELLGNHGLRKGDNRVAFAPDGSLWVGQTDHGWAGDKGIQRISWTGKVPLDVKEMHLTKTGFEMIFTKPLEANAANNAESYKVRHYYYEYHAPYGSKEFDSQEEVPKSVKVSEDRTKVTLEFEQMVAWRVYEFHLKGLKGDDGEEIANPLVAYTLNHLVGAKTPPPPPPGPGAYDKPAEEDKKAIEKKNDVRWSAGNGEKGEDSKKGDEAKNGEDVKKADDAKKAADSKKADEATKGEESTKSDEAAKATPKPKSYSKPKSTPTPTPASTPAATPAHGRASKPGKKATPAPTPTPTPKKK
jgi:glucose/arabinose dehydrogenase